MPEHLEKSGPTHVGIEVTGEYLCHVVNNREEVVELAANILDSLSKSERPLSPATVYNRLIIALGPLGGLILHLLSERAIITALNLDALEKTCIEEGVDPVKFLKFRELISRYYDKLHSVMARIPPVLGDFHVYPDKKTGAVYVVLRLEDESKVGFLIARSEAMQLANALRQAADSLDMSGDDNKDEEDVDDEESQATVMGAMKNVGSLIESKGSESKSLGDTIHTI